MSDEEGEVLIEFVVRNRYGDVVQSGDWVKRETDRGPEYVPVTPVKIHHGDTISWTMRETTG